MHVDFEPERLQLLIAPKRVTWLFKAGQLKLGVFNFIVLNFIIKIL